MKRFALILIFSSMYLLAGCSAEETNGEKKEEATLQSTEAANMKSADMGAQKAAPVEFSENDQTFRILSIHDEILEYTDTVLEDSSLVKKDVYTDKVVIPLEQKLSDVDADLYTDYYTFLSPNTNIEKLQASAAEMKEQQERINGLVKEAAGAATGLLAGTDKTILVIPADPTNVFVVDKMEGVTGGALSENLILLQIDPSFNEDILKYAVAKFYLYATQMEYGANYSENLVEAFVTDGKGDAFASLVYPGVSPAWTEPLSQRMKDKAFEELKESENEFTDGLYAEFNGFARRGIPLWTNFKLGLEITQSYLGNHQDMSIEEWTQLPPGDIIAGSDFTEEYKDLQNITD
ncbi:hypothetical protein FZC84_14350 [Rossellomorea vietnamensis]|uniref:DUF2268 domain-containing protein n=1 Tax=Rossellomorea vietnamensis TaxID=218284 RepID=A0A5D4M9K8_9BACI|nr:DUF2268 domain-containing putative Zn-dependent protease [Rossellomorea vietnamensis]TYR98609.1 hypothetical protein FZC84_14350 [Rossellomorea vietnamensis]